MIARMRLKKPKKEEESSSSKQNKSDPAPLKAINVPVIDVLAGMPNYGKFLKYLVSNKSKMEQISVAFLNKECTAIVLNKLPPKLEGIVLGHKVSNTGLEVDKAKINVIAKLPPPINDKAVIEQVAVRSGMDSKVAELTMSSPNRSTSDIEDAFSSMNILNYTSVSEELLPPKKRICSSSSSSTTLSNSSWNQTCDLVSPSSSVYTPTPPQIFEIGKCSDKMYLKHHEGQIKDILNYLDELYLYHIC
ncbi:hypothetical protein Tco_0874042 [Tanacetum coccineum]|uniref:Uncharacterized protein n=1 Tax=Tanacetum coccineum TaxID=301880 RepID=A0ABQ5BKJ0_9ASTR